MRLSADHRTGGNVLERRLCKETTVYLNGKKVDMCIVADEEEGYVTYWPKEVINSSTYLEPVTEQGYVEIRDPKGEHKRASYEERPGQGKGITYRVHRSFVEESERNGHDWEKWARDTFGERIEIVIVDNLDGEWEARRNEPE